VTTKEALERILREIAAAGHPITDRGQIDDRHFGNFVVGFAMDGQCNRLVNDRSQIIRYIGAGFDDGHLVIDDLTAWDGDAFSVAIRAELQQSNESSRER
jgi:hypothetical protein